MSAPDFPDSGADQIPDRIKADAAALADTAQSDLSQVVDEVKHQASALGEEAKGQLADATDKAKEVASGQKDLLANQLGGVSDALQKVAGELDTNGNAGGRYVRMLADGAEKLTATVRDNDVDQIVGIAQDFGRKQPVAFMGAAALLGFVASRFVLASATRTSDVAAELTPPSYGTGERDNLSGTGNQGGRNGGY